MSAITDKWGLDIVRKKSGILDSGFFENHYLNQKAAYKHIIPNQTEHSGVGTMEATQLLVQSLVISRLDYCNSLLAGLPLRAIRPLQLVQNAAAHLIFNLPKFTPVTPLLRSLHWLPVVARIRLKTLMLAYKAKNGPAPPYLMAMDLHATITEQSPNDYLVLVFQGKLLPNSGHSLQYPTTTSKIQLLNESSTVKHADLKGVRMYSKYSKVNSA
ncbi:hypothetical protein NFI96_000445 [Prochilodus magdalenae]|nr:hypothetical protein NFI96_000445 [Prochilodus magdalenae]